MKNKILTGLIIMLSVRIMVAQMSVSVYSYVPCNPTITCSGGIAINFWTTNFPVTYTLCDGMGYCIIGTTSVSPDTFNTCQVSSGTYTIYATDALGNFGSTNFYGYAGCSGYPTIYYISSSSTMPACDSLCNGSAKILINSSNFPVNYTVCNTGGNCMTGSTLSSTITLNNLCSGSYTITAIDTTHHGAINHFYISQTTCTDIREIKSVFSERIHIYPNPSDGHIYIKTDIKEKDVTAEVYDLTGKLLIKTQIEFNKNVHINLPQGAYLLKIKCSAVTEIKKLIIE